MHVIFSFFIALLALVICHHLWTRVPRLPRAREDWGAVASDDPRVAVAGMMYAVAAADGSMSNFKEQQILLLLQQKLGLDEKTARLCLTGGRRVARRLDGDLNSRLHQMLPMIAQKCGPEEKKDVVEMLQTVSGSSGDRIGPVRDGIGRVAASLLDR